MRDCKYRVKMSTAKNKDRTVYKGLPLSDGVVCAKVCLFNDNRHDDIPDYQIAPEALQREKNRLLKTVALVERQLEELHEKVGKQLGMAEAEIFTVQRMILQDEKLLAEMMQYFDDEMCNTEQVVGYVLDKYETRLLEIDNDHIRGRASDIGELRRRLLDLLLDTKPSFQCDGLSHCQKGKHRIVVAGELTPSLTIDLNPSDIFGFVTEHGGRNAHAAILARSLGIPAVSGIKDIVHLVTCGAELLVDGSIGEVIVWPNAEDKKRVDNTKNNRAWQVNFMTPVPGFCVMGNISTVRDVDEVLRVHAEGVGLYRTEFEFMTANRVLSEDEQYERYEAVVRALDGKPVTFRLLDIGGDKPCPFLNLPKEDNPVLGWRGSRLLLGRPELLRDQARALARVSQIAPVNVLYPMIVDLKQYRALRQAFDEAVGSLETGSLEHGIMFEVPSACLQAEELLAEVDFASVGTNDLVQYLFAVDRNNEHVAYDCSPDRPVFWSLLTRLVSAAEKAGKPISVCGEMGSAPAYVRRLFDIGFNTVSVSPGLVPEVRRTISHRDNKEE